MCLSLEGNWDEPVERDDLPTGDYLFEVTEPKDPTKAVRVSTWDKNDPTSGPKYKFINHTLRVVAGEQEGRLAFYSTMFWADPEAIAEARAPYDPRSGTYNFLLALGLAERKRVGNKTQTIISKEAKNKDGSLDLTATYGKRFYGQYGPNPRRIDPETNEPINDVLKVWKEV